MHCGEKEDMYEKKSIDSKTALFYFTLYTRRPLLYLCIVQIQHTQTHVVCVLHLWCTVAVLLVPLAAVRSVCYTIIHLYTVKLKGSFDILYTLPCFTRTQNVLCAVIIHDNERSHVDYLNKPAVPSHRLLDR